MGEGESGRGRGGGGRGYHEEGPCCVVEKDCGGYDEHC